MPKLANFAPPAGQNDLDDQPALDQAFRARWSDNISRYTEATLQNDPWSSVNQPPLTDYYNPLSTEAPSGAAPIAWTAFPNRIKLAFPEVGQRTQWKYADDGPPGSYRPGGPRGWQDEYCEWSVTRNANNQIIRVSFTCENREYWYTLWAYSPERVLQLYQQLVSPDVKLEELWLRDSSTGDPLIDPETGRPAYNGLNKWNNSTTQGAVHLISSPNSLSAEIFLAGQATVLRETADGKPITDRNQLIQCSRYGTPGRNSDPTIGAFVNNVVRQGNRVSLTNPVGLYIQAPNFNQYQLPFTAPAGRKPADYWKVVRGHARGQGEAIDYILHATYEVPESDGFTVSDITINGFNIDFGAQITDTMQVALAGTPIARSGPEPKAYRCAGPSQKPLPRAYVMAYSEVLDAAMQSSLNLRIEQGQTAGNVVVYLFDGDSRTRLAAGGSGVQLEQTGYKPLDGGSGLVSLTVTVAPNAELGERSVQATNSDGSHGPPAFGLFEVVAPGTLAAQPKSIGATAKAMDRSFLRGLELRR